MRCVKQLQNVSFFIFTLFIYLLNITNINITLHTNYFIAFLFAFA